MNLRGLSSLTVAAVLWGTVPIAAKGVYQVADTNPLSVAFFRLALALPVLLPVALRLGRPRMARRDLAFTLLFGVAMALYQVCYFAAIPRVGVTIAALITLCGAPVLVAVMSVVFLQEKLTPRALLAMAGAITGTILLVGMPSIEEGGTMDVVTGVALAVGAALSFAVVILAGRAVAERCHSLQVTAVGMAVGALLLLPFSLATGFVLRYSPIGWALLIHLGLIPTALSYLLFLDGLRFVTATVASVINLPEPPTSTMLAWLIFGERLGSYGLLGALLLLGAVFLLYWPGARQPAVV